MSKKIEIKPEDLVLVPCVYRGPDPIFPVRYDPTATTYSFIQDKQLMAPLGLVREMVLTKNSRGCTDVATARAYDMHIFEYPGTIPLVTEEEKPEETEAVAAGTDQQ